MTQIEKAGDIKQTQKDTIVGNVWDKRIKPSKPSKPKGSGLKKPKR